MRKDNFNRNYILNLLDTFGSMTISDIAKKVNLSRPSVYSHLEILEKKGLIKRDKNPKKKGSPVTITPINKKISEKDTQELIKLLKKVKNSHGIDMKELREELHNHSYLEAGMRGFITKKVFLTKKGEEFLNKKV